MKKRKQPITLIEIMIVIFLIGLIGSVLGYNMKGSLEEGKAFKTEQASLQIRDLLLLEAAKGTPLTTVVANPKLYLSRSGFVKNVEKLLEDGWGGAYEITASSRERDIRVISRNLERYNAKKGKLPVQEPEDEESEEPPIE